MKISVSSLGFCGHPIYTMGSLAPEIGIEIFYEWGCETYWELALDTIMRGRAGKLSIHAPYQGHITEMSLTDEEDRLFEYLRQPFRLYHRYGGEGYIVHMNAPYDRKPTGGERAERLKRVADRLHRFGGICAREGVTMLVENLAFGPGQETLCDQAAFLRLFADDPSLHCIIDIGHAALGGIDVLAAQKALGPRVRAYHVHDNDGVKDLHQRIGTGVADWKRFFEGARAYTPDANFVMEYSARAVPGISAYADDAQAIRDGLTAR